MQIHSKRGNNMAKLTLKDGSILEVENGVTFLDAAKKISEGLARNAVAVKVDGALKDLTAVVENDCAFEVLTFADDEGKKFIVIPRRTFSRRR